MQKTLVQAINIFFDRKKLQNFSVIKSEIPLNFRNCIFKFKFRVVKAHLDYQNPKDFATEMPSIEYRVASIIYKKSANLSTRPEGSLSGLL